MSPAANFAVIDAEVRKAIGEAAQKWFYVGYRLAKIKEGKLYAGKHDSWKAYCEDISGFSRRRADQLITDVKERAALIEALGSNGNPVPLLNERITRELAQEPTPEAKAEIIQDVMKAGQPVNSGTVRKAREKRAKAQVIDAATGKPEPEKGPVLGNPVQTEWKFIVLGEEDNTEVRAEATEHGIEIGSALDGNERETITWDEIKSAMKLFSK